MKQTDLRVARLELVNFRCYQRAQLELPPCQLVMVVGSNGSGKTSLLEAISLLVSAQGLRQANALEVSRDQEPQPWQVSCQLVTPNSNLACLSSAALVDGKMQRQLRVDGKKSSCNELRRHLPILWLTPALDRVLVESRSQRLRFIDHLITLFYPNHKTCCRRYARLQQERLKLLTEQPDNSSWLSGLEVAMAEQAVIIAANRVQWSRQLAAQIGQGLAGFPSLAMTLIGETEQLLLAGAKALACEEELAAAYQQTRLVDKLTQRTSKGVQKSDFSFQVKGRQLALCSTGEQKVLLLTLILNLAVMIKNHLNYAPLLLLDEVVNNLDPTYRAALFQAFAASSSQIWLTSSDQAELSPWREMAVLVQIANNNGKQEIKVKN